LWPRRTSNLEPRTSSCYFDAASLSDRICAPDQAQALWEHWERPSIHWFEGSHLAHFGRRAVRERLAVHLRETLFVPGEVTLSRFRRRSGDVQAERAASGAPAS